MKEESNHTQYLHTWCYANVIITIAISITISAKKYLKNMWCSTALLHSRLASCFDASRHFVTVLPPGEPPAD